MFINSCYVKRNNFNPKIINKLSNIGYKVFDVPDYPYLQCSNGYINAVENKEDCIGYNCLSNEDLFFAIAAIRDDSDKNQFFVGSKAGYMLLLYNDKKTIEEYLNKIDISDYPEDVIHKLHKATVNDIYDFYLDEE